MSDTSSTIFEQVKASFGAKTVNLEDKQELVNEVFAKSANTYDIMNDVMSAGLHRLWKDDMINWLAPPKGATSFKLLDVAGGTGDIAERFIKASGDGAKMVICDISPEMLDEGKRRAYDRGLEQDITFTEGNAEHLPFADKSFDAYTISFGIRNVPRIEQALKEAHRVLRTGGRFLCLEFSDVQMPFLDKLYDLYSFHTIPRLGELIANDRESYQYLVESIRRFPDQDDFADMIRHAGFSQVKYKNLTGGIAALHSGWRL
ncbi:MAG: bifunctional demethylmenaquinone methyltransferase/2-methoxy-6-polyprenyl-1,4-benzoquinol methylase UbiE [Pseudomonadota bacterium]